ncbi:MAG: MarR family transcriptional regulator [Rhodothermales bacterium]|nr:MarR family transcriptional regulator [Rhodothermales bacterium]
MSTLAELIKQDHFASPAQESMLNVLVTYPWLLGELTAAMAPHDVTPAQYNVLRILRGRHPEPVTCSYIGERLLDRTPDVTRLLNRLEKAGLITRKRADYDRRVVEVAVTEVGLERLEELEGPVEAATRRLTSGLSDAEHRQLSALLEKLRCNAETAAPSAARC